MKKVVVGGITFVIIALITGVAYLQSTGEKTSCRSGFENVTEGRYMGYKSCTTRSGIRYELCFNLTNSANTENYWCNKAISVPRPTEPPVIIITRSRLSGDFDCVSPSRGGCSRRKWN